MKAMKTFAALLALAFSLAGCGAVDGDPVRPATGSAGQGSSTAASGADSAEPEQLAALLSGKAADSPATDEYEETEGYEHEN